MLRWKNFPHHFIVKSFLEIIQLITLISFGGLCHFPAPAPFYFHGWAPKRNMDTTIYSGRRQLERYRTAVWGREASRKWEWASLQTVWGVVEGRMLIKIINNCWKEKWITTLLSERWGEPGSPLALPAPAAESAEGAFRSAAGTFLRTDRTTFQTT